MRKKGHKKARTYRGLSWLSKNLRYTTLKERWRIKTYLLDVWYLESLVRSIALPF